MSKCHPCKLKSILFWYLIMVFLAAKNAQAVSVIEFSYKIQLRGVVWNCVELLGIAQRETQRAL